MKKKKIGLLLACASVLACAGTTTACLCVSKRANVTNNVVAVAKTSEANNVSTEEDKLKEWINTFIVPLLSGVSLTGFVSMCVSIVIALINRKTNALIKASNKETIDNALNVLTNAKNLISSVNDLKDISEETKKSFVENTNKLIESASKLTQDTEKILEIKNILITLSEIEAQIASVNKDAIKSGVIVKVNELKEQVKKLG